MVPPKNTTAFQGTRVKLDCQAESYPNNISYRWFKNDVDVQNVPGDDYNDDDGGGVGGDGDDGDYGGGGVGALPSYHFPEVNFY